MIRSSGCRNFTGAGAQAERSETMKQLFLAAVSIGSLAAATPASAQGIPVFDSTSVLKHIEQIQKTKQMIEQGRQQIAEAQQRYQGLNQLTDVSSIANQLKTDSLRTLGVDVNSLERMARGDFSGGGGYGGRSDAIYQDMLERLGVSANGDQTNVRYQTARRTEEHTSELQSLMRISYAVSCLKKKLCVTKSLITLPFIQLQHLQRR